MPAPRGDDLPGAGDPKAVGKAPPLPQATARTREERRFDHYDRNRDGIIARNEMMASRANDFRKLDKDGNNLLSFEEWGREDVRSLRRRRRQQGRQAHPCRVRHDRAEEKAGACLRLRA